MKKTLAEEIDSNNKRKPGLTSINDLSGGLGELVKVTNSMKSAFAPIDALTSPIHKFRHPLENITGQFSWMDKLASHNILGSGVVEVASAFNKLNLKKNHLLQLSEAINSQSFDLANHSVIGKDAF